MPTALVLFTIKAISALLNLRREAKDSGIVADVKALIAKLTPSLPAKPDGTAWTDDDIHLAAAAARVPWQELHDRTDKA